MAGIARTLNALGVPSPSAHDRVRNRHRSGEAWTLRSVAAILANPRYTGRQVWNRQYIDHNETSAGDKATSGGSVYRWNPKDQWVVSSQLAHPALVSEEDFVKAQAVSAVAPPVDGRVRRYLLTGLVTCEVCGRRADGHWVHDRPSYRCRHGRTSVSPATPGRAKAVYWREDELLARAGRQLESALAAGADHRATAAHIRGRKLRIVCGHDSVIVKSEEPGSPPAAHRTNPHRRRKSPSWG